MCVDDSYSEWSSKRFACQQDVRELNRIYALEDPRPSQTLDADAVSIAECNRIWRNRTGVQHRLNLLPRLQVNQGVITPIDLRAEAHRLIAAGRMPNLDELRKAVTKAREKYRPQIIAARRLAKKRG